VRVILHEYRCRNDLVDFVLPGQVGRCVSLKVPPNSGGARLCGVQATTSRPISICHPLFRLVRQIPFLIVKNVRYFETFCNGETYGVYICSGGNGLFGQLPTSGSASGSRDFAEAFSPQSLSRRSSFYYCPTILSCGDYFNQTNDNIFHDVLLFL
jgi:hypothetical protein